MNEQIKKFGKWNVIFSEGDPSDDLFIIKRGLVRIATIGKGGVLKTLGFRKEKEFLGEHSMLIGDGKRHLIAIAEEETEIIKVPYGDLKKILGKCPPWVNSLFKTLVMRSKYLHNLMIEHHIEDEEIIRPLNREDEGKIRKIITDYQERR
jgi:CRP-like cAMP-binding protein